ncbi:hypothetical protein GCM10028804_01780 [Larkinella terrae]
MVTIPIEVSEEIIQAYGIKAIQEQFQKQLEWEKLRLAALRLKTALDEAGLDYDEIAREARAKAWETYKYKIKDKLPPEAFE